MLAGIMPDGLGSDTGTGWYRSLLQIEYRGICVLGLTHDVPCVSCCAWFIFKLHVIFTALWKDKLKKSQDGCTNTSFALLYSHKPAHF